MPTCNKHPRLLSLALSVIIFLSTPLSAESAATDTQTTTVKYAPTAVDMVVKKVSKHVYYVEGMPGIATDNEGFISNAGFIVTSDGVVVFDSLGTPCLLTS